VVEVRFWETPRCRAAYYPDGDDVRKIQGVAVTGKFPANPESSKEDD
jgi:hypothetical protein